MLNADLDEINNSDNDANLIKMFEHSINKNVIDLSLLSITSSEQKTLIKKIILLERNINMNNSTLISSLINQIIVNAITTESLQEKAVTDVSVTSLKDF